MRAILEPLGFSVLSARDGPTCLALRRRRAARPVHPRRLDARHGRLGRWPGALRARGLDAPDPDAVGQYRRRRRRASAASGDAADHDAVLPKPFDLATPARPRRARCWCSTGSRACPRPPSAPRLLPIPRRARCRRRSPSCAPRRHRLRARHRGQARRPWRRIPGTRRSSRPCASAWRASTSTGSPNCSTPGARIPRAWRRDRPEPPLRDIVLVVDDTPDTLGFLTEALERAGITALVATGGPQAAGAGRARARPT